MGIWLRFGTLRWAVLALLLAVAVFVFAVTYGATLRATEVNAARADAERRASLEAGALLAEVDKFRVLPFVLTELPDVSRTLVGRSTEARKGLDRTFAALAEDTGAAVLYAIDQRGTARSASNASREDSFVGHDFRFRPYYAEALRNGASEYYAQGSVTGRLGMFLARRAGTEGRPAGVIVVKIEFDRIERLWRFPRRLSMVADRDGVIIIASDPSLRLKTTRSITAGRRAQIIAARQFADAPLADAGLRFDGRGFATDAAGARYIAVERPLPILGWRHFHLEPIEPALDAANSRVRFATLIFALGLTTLALIMGWSMTRRRRMEVARAALEAEVSKRTLELTDALDRLRREGEERAKADRRYRAAREELAQANRLGSIGTITTSVAHEINQPVSAIRTAAENGVKLLARGQPERAGTNLELIVSLTQRIGAITGELLSYARRGRRELATIGLDEVVDGALMLIGDSFRQAGVSLEVSRGANLPRIHASRIRLEQVLVNILHNALDAVAGRDDAHVLLEVAVDEDAVRISIHDNGPGLPPDLGETVFQPFVTGKSHGTGLGLGISREIMADHGGTLTADASPLGGAVFHALLFLHSKDLR